MTPTLTALERFLERLVERPIGRLFRAHVELEQVRRRLERAMAEGRRPDATRTVAPDRYRILLEPDDLAALLRGHPSAEPMLSDGARGFAQQRGWQFADRPVVTLHPSDAVARGDIVVSATFTPIDDGTGDGASGSVPGPAATAVLTVAALEGLVLVVATRGWPERRIALGGSVLRIGRAVDNEIVLADERVSRHHGLITRAQGALVYRDLASANGSFLHGQRVDEVALGAGDELTLGSSSLRLVVG